MSPRKPDCRSSRIFCSARPRFFTGRGRIAIVLVTPLEEAAEEMLKRAGMELLYRERTANHAIFHYRGPGTGREERFPVYVRKTGNFSLESLPYSLDTVYNIPDFDEQGFAVRNVGAALKGYRFSGRFLFLNPGQGHIPAFVLGRAGRIDSVVLAGNDLLAIRTSERNVRTGVPSGGIARFHSPGPYACREAGSPGTFTFLWADIQPVPGAVSEWLAELLETAGILLENGGFLSVSGSSSDIFQFARQITGFRITEDRKFRGSRCLLLKKRS